MYAGSHATFDLDTEDEKFSLHKGKSECFILIVRTHAEPQREHHICNT